MFNYNLNRLKSISEYVKYSDNKKVIFITISDDIVKMSGSSSNETQKININCMNDLFTHISIKNNMDNDSLVIPKDVPIIYYGGRKDEARAFCDKFKLNPKNMFNIPDEAEKSGDKDTFHKLFPNADFIPKVVFTKKEAINGDVGFPVIAKIKNGHSGIGVAKFDTKEDLVKSKDKYDIFSEYIDFTNEFRCMMIDDKCYMINERVPYFDKNKTIKTKKPNDAVEFMYVYTDENKIPKKFKNEIAKISKEIRKKIKLGIWSLDVVMDKDGKLWCLEINAATGMGAAKLVDTYFVVVEKYYGKPLSNDFKINKYKEHVVPAHKMYYPKNKKEIESSLWPMDYENFIKKYS